MEREGGREDEKKEKASERRGRKGETEPRCRHMRIDNNLNWKQTLINKAEQGEIINCESKEGGTNQSLNYGETRTEKQKLINQNLKKRQGEG